MGAIGNSFETSRKTLSFSHFGLIDIIPGIQLTACPCDFLCARVAKLVDALA
jgi:hypothetical protein